MSSMPSNLRRAVVGVTVAIALVLAGLVGWMIGVRSAGPAADAAVRADPDLGPAPSYDGLTNQLGQTVGSSAFHGKVQVVTFLFPYCTTYCPLVAAHLAGLGHMLEQEGLQDRVAIVAFNVDPAGTGPAQMRAFLKEYGWDPADTHWQYLTGAPDAIRRVVTGGFHVDYRKVSTSDTDSAQGPPATPQPEVVNHLAQRAHVGYDIVHNDALAIVDANGRVRRYYTDADVVSNAELMSAINALVPGVAH